MKDENIRKLREMRLPAFANAYIAQLEQPDKFAEMTFDERMAVMIDKEYDSRNSNRIKRLLKKSGLPSTKASIGDIAYLPERKLDRDLINRLGTCDFIAKKRNVLVLGATGAGKTFLANAIAADACRDGWHALYVRLPDFFIEYANAAALHKEFEILKKYQKASLLVLDEFLLIVGRSRILQCGFDPLLPDPFLTKFKLHTPYAFELLPVGNIMFGIPCIIKISV